MIFTFFKSFRRIDRLLFKHAQIRFEFFGVALTECLEASVFEPSPEFAREPPIVSARKRRDQMRVKLAKHSGFLESSWRMAIDIGFYLDFRL
jgi:hypothetical protein